MCEVRKNLMKVKKREVLGESKKWREAKKKRCSRTGKEKCYRKERKVEKGVNKNMAEVKADGIRDMGRKDGK